MYPDMLAPPGTDTGATINAQWPLGMLLFYPSFWT